MRVRYSIWIISLMLVVFSTAEAGTTGKISGTVKDAQSGEGLVGVNVVVSNTSLGASTNVDGYYVILNVQPGKYTLVASAIGYTKQTVTDVSVSVDLTTKIDFQLSTTVVELGHEIVVTAERPVVKKDLTSSEAHIDAEQIKDLPVTEVTDVLSLQSGITVDRGGGIHIRGGRASEVAYWVDGISVSDSYDGGQAIHVDNNAVQELQVISGTFNAEYGQAMSGVVNIVTKNGEQQYHGSISMYSGGYLTGDGGSNNNTIAPLSLNPIIAPYFFPKDKIFYNLGGFRPYDNQNMQASMSGPVPRIPNLTFYATGRYFRSSGWLYGNRIFNTDGSIDTTALKILPGSNGSQVQLLVGDNPIPMNYREQYSGQAKLSYQIGNMATMSLTAIGSKVDYRDYNRDYALEPEGDVNKFDRGDDITAKWTHTLSATSFYEIHASYLYRAYREYLYANPLDPRYIVDPQIDVKGSYEFNHAGTNLHHFNRRTETRSAKFDYTNQISSLHEVKAGVEGRLHRLYLEDYSLIPDPNNAALPSIPGPTTPEYEQYTEKPVEFSAYAQDKLEYEHMIVNVGLRYDYFNSNGNVLTDPSDPNVYLPFKDENKALTLDQRLAKWYRKASAKTLLSPRLGISYPITDRGILHFSYGHFLQIPSFQNLYQSPEYKVTTASGTQGVYGNPDLDAQKTVMYEIGLQQQLTDVLSFDVTGFYRDTRNWVTTSPPIPVGDPETATTYYTMYVNHDYSNSRGVTLTVNQRPRGLFQFNFSYTFQVAEGNNSNPDDAFAAELSNSSPAIALTPLDWDQTHTANLTVGIGQLDWGVFAIGTYGSGLPYSPVVNQAENQGRDVSSAIRTNSRRQPSNYTIDLRLFKNVKFSTATFNFFVKVLNLFDRRNETTVYGQTGRATATPAELGVENVGPEGRANPIAEYLVRPDYYSTPREIQIGAELEF